MPSHSNVMHPMRLFGRAACAGALVILAGCASDAVAPRSAGVTPQAIGVTTMMYYTAVSTGDTHACAIKVDDTVVCWGNNDVLQGEVPGDLGTVKQVAAGGDGTCVLKTDDTVVCWGGVTYPAIPPGLGTVKQIAVKGSACAIKVDDTLACWGYGGGLTVPSDLGTVKQVAPGWLHTCAIKMDDTLACWGDDAHGQSTIPSGLGTVKQVAAGFTHTCAIKTNDYALCWGSNDLQESPAIPYAVIQVAAGDKLTCVIYVFGRGECWGDNTYRQATIEHSVFPIKQISVFTVDTCALKTDNTLACWGLYSDAPLYGAPVTTTKHYLPTAVFTAPRRTQAGASFNVALTGAQVITPGGTWSAGTAGIQYAFDCGTGYSVFSSTATASCPAGAAGLQSVKGKLHDRDGDETEYVTTVIVTEYPPSGLSGSVTGTTIHLSWTDNSATETSFQISRRSKVLGIWEAWALIASPAAGATSYDDSGEAGGRYQYAVRACNGSECSVDNRVVVTVPGPAAPVNASASVVSATSIRIDWQDASSNETKFMLQRREHDGTTWGVFTDIGETAADATSYTSTSLSMGVNYQFRVMACNALVCSGSATTARLRISATVPARPSNVVAIAASNEVTWDDLSLNEASFEVQRRTNTGGVWSAFADIGQTPANEESFIEAGLTDGKHQFRVRACNALGCSAYATGPVVIHDL